MRCNRKYQPGLLNELSYGRIQQIEIDEERLTEAVVERLPVILPIHHESDTSEIIKDLLTYNYLEQFDDEGEVRYSLVHEVIYNHIKQI